MEQLSIIMPCIIKRGNWALCQLRRANNPSTPKSFTSFAMYLNQHISRQIDLLSNGIKEGVSENANTRSWWGSFVLFFVYLFYFLFCFE